MNPKVEYSLKIFATNGKLTPKHPEYFDIKAMKSRSNTICYELKPEHMTKDNVLKLKNIDEFTTKFSGKNAFLEEYFIQSKIPDEPTIVIYKVKKDYVNDKKSDGKLKPLFYSDLAMSLLDASDMFGSTLNHLKLSYKNLKKTCWDALFQEKEVFTFYDYLNEQKEDVTVSSKIMNPLHKYYHSCQRETPNKEYIESQKELNKISTTKLHEYEAMRGLVVSYLDYQKMYTSFYESSKKQRLLQEEYEKNSIQDLEDNGDIYNIELFEKKFIKEHEKGYYDYITGLTREQRDQFDAMIHELRKRYRVKENSKRKWQEGKAKDLLLLKDDYMDKEKRYLEALNYALKTYQFYQDMVQVTDDSIEGFETDIQSGSIIFPIEFSDSLSKRK